MKLKQVLKEVYFDTELLLSHVLGKSKAFLYSHPEYELTDLEYESLQQLLQQQKLGVPMAYILGKQAFWTFDLHVTSDVLIPRPETECLVEQVLELLPADLPCDVADLGTGSGAIAIAIAKERPHWRLTAADISLNALNIAQENAERLNISTIQFQQGDWCHALPHKHYDAIVANPPYIAEDDPALEMSVRNYEPKNAVIAGSSGLESIETIISQAKKYLKPTGYLLLEHGYQQAQATQRLLKENGYINYDSKKDYAEQFRVSFGQSP